MRLFLALLALLCVVSARAGDLDSRLAPMRVDQHWTFGTAGTVRNTRDLAASFDAFQAWTGPIKLNGEAQRYQAFAAGNHTFDRDTLWLTGEIDRRTYTGGMALQSAALAKPAETRDGVTVLTLADWPAKPILGASVGHPFGGLTNSSRDDVRAVTANEAAKMVVVRPAITDKLAAGDRVIFGPPVTSAQIWSKATVPLGRGKTVAVDAVLRLPDDSAFGSWAALWLYGKNDATNRGHPNAADELDVIERYVDGVRNDMFSGNNHPIDLAAIERFDGRLAAAPLYAKASRSLAGEHRLTIIVEPERTLRFLDGELVKVDRYRWRNPNPAQIGINLAIGSSKDGIPGLLWPRDDADFANMRLGVMSLTILTAE